MAYYIKRGNNFSVSSEGSLDIRDRLEKGTYVLSRTMELGFYLEKTEDDFNSVKKYYGNTLRRAERILNTFNSRSGTTGVLLSGEKGSGKTLLAKTIARNAIAQDVPVIITNTAFCGDEYNKFIASIDQPCMLLFDEFEKVYDKNEQKQLLTLLDGVFPSKKLFVFTCNDVWDIDTHMRNRPGRIFYSFEFSGIELEFVTEYGKDNLKNQDHLKQLEEVAGLVSKFNFDMLQAIVEECNRYDSTPKEALEWLNISFSEENYPKYDVLCFNKKTKKPVMFPKRKLKGSIVFDSHIMTLDGFTIEVLLDKHDYSSYLHFDQTHFKEYDVSKKQYVFENDEYIVYLSDQNRKPIRMTDLIY